MSAVFKSAYDWLVAQTPAIQRIKRERLQRERAAFDADGYLAAAQRDYNDGARVADDGHCPSCGARGYRHLCPRCER